MWMLSASSRCKWVSLVMFGPRAVQRAEVKFG
jgi:hypothetical protein